MKQNEKRGEEIEKVKKKMKNKKFEKPGKGEAHARDGNLEI